MAAMATQEWNMEPAKVLCLVVPAVINPAAVAAQLGLALQPEEESFRKNLRWSLWPVATRKYYFQSTCVHSRWHWRWLAYWLNLSLYLKKKNTWYLVSSDSCFCVYTELHQEPEIVKRVKCTAVLLAVSRDWLSLSSLYSKKWVSKNIETSPRV